MDGDEEQRIAWMDPSYAIKIGKGAVSYQHGNTVVHRPGGTTYLTLLV